MNSLYFISPLILLLFLVVSVQAQYEYSNEYLESASAETLQKYLQKAEKQKKIGGIMTLTGPAMVVAGALLVYNYPGYYYDAAFAVYSGMVIAGLASTLVGIPILLVNTSRVKRINDLLPQSGSGIKIDLEPDAQYNLATQNYQPAITLKIWF